MSTGRMNIPIFSLWMSSDLVFRAILGGFTSGENLEHDFGPQTFWKDTHMEVDQ